MPVIKSKEDTWSSKELENQLKAHNSTTNMEAKKSKTLKNGDHVKSTDSDRKKSDKKDSTDKHRSSSVKKDKQKESRHKDTKSIYSEPIEIKDSKTTKEKTHKTNGDSEKSKSKSSEKNKSSKIVDKEENIKIKAAKSEYREPSKSKHKKKEIENSEYEDDFETYDDDFDKESEDEVHIKKSKHKSIKEEPRKETTKRTKSRHKSIEPNDKPIRNSSISPERNVEVKKKNKNKHEVNEIQNMNELQKAMDLEQHNLLSNKKHQNPDGDNENEKLLNESDPTLVQTSAINFKKKKSNDSKNIVPQKRLADEIEEKTNAANQYELIFMNYYNSNKSLAYSQTGDDDIGMSIQTDEIMMCNKWTQHPMHVFLQASGDDSSKNIMELDINLNVSLFNKFIQNVGKVMLSVLEDNVSENLFKNVQQVKSNLSVSEAFIELKSIDLIEDRIVKYTCTSDLSNHIFVSIHMPHSLQSNGMQSNLTHKGIISLWNIFESNSPQRMLISETHANCCCFHPSNLNIIFAGLNDGSISIWDTRLNIYGFKSNIPYQYQSYTTACQKNENHHSEVVSIAPIVSQNRDSTNKQKEQLEISAFQLATLEADSIIYLWVMSENISKDIAGSQSELGLAPGAQIKLIRSQCISLSSPIKSFSGNFTSLELRVLPSDNDHMFILTNIDGVILNEHRFKNILPKTFKSRTLANAKSIDFSPFMGSIFMVGYDDGCLSIFHVDKEVNLTCWENSTDGNGIITIRWCRSRPSVFFVLDSESNFYIWDLSVDYSAPLKSQRTFNKKATTFFLSGNKDYKHDSRSQNMVIFYEDGSSELHKVKPELSALLANEMIFFTQLIQSYF